MKPEIEAELKRDERVAFSTEEAIAGLADAIKISALAIVKAIEMVAEEIQLHR